MNGYSHHVLLHDCNTDYWKPQAFNYHKIHQNEEQVGKRHVIIIAVFINNDTLKKKVLKMRPPQKGGFLHATVATQRPQAVMDSLSSPPLPKMASCGHRCR
jgi:hypothetical protein